ncbi:MAG: phosphotransferase family protein [Actinomycetota bacterium]
MMSPESLANADDNIAGWFETEFGGTVIDLTRQTRWRPVWFATVERDGERHDLCVRGDRTDMPLIFPLEHEMTLQRLLGEHGIPVATVRGWIDEPMAYVMDRVSGQEHFPDVPDEERAAAVDDYLAILARIHALPVEPFAAAGIRRADDPAESGLVGLRRYEEHYRSQKVHPDPFLEFCLGWLARNPVDTRGREAPIVWDSGQFHHENGRIVAVLDLEIGHIGDPMMDLAAWRMRDTIVGYGDMAALYARYEELSGAPVDIEAIQWHHMMFTLSNQLAYSHALREPSPASDLMTNLQWCYETNLFATEAWAEKLGLDLPTVDMPEPRVSTADVGHAHMTRALRSIATDDPFVQHEVRVLFRLARHLARRDEIGDAVEAADLDDLERLLGARPHDWRDGEAKLERFVLDDATGAHDHELVRLFHRRNLRAHMTLGPPGSAMTHHHTIQPF